jgi:hypothetical protein
MLRGAGVTRRCRVCGEDIKPRVYQKSTLTHVQTGRRRERLDVLVLVCACDADFLDSMKGGV